MESDHPACGKQPRESDEENLPDWREHGVRARTVGWNLLSPGEAQPQLGSNIKADLLPYWEEQTETEPTDLVNRMLGEPRAREVGTTGKSSP